MVKVSAEIIELIKKHGEETYPEECCGVLIGKFSQDGKEVFELLKIENSRESERNRRFLITPENYLMAEKYSRGKNLDIVGFYHSHPDHPAKPSDYDREHALPFLSYFIVSVESGIAKEINSWVLRDDRSGFELEEIKVKNKM